MRPAPAKSVEAPAQGLYLRKSELNQAKSAARLITRRRPLPAMRLG